MKSQMSVNNKKYLNFCKLKSCYLSVPFNEKLLKYLENINTNILLNFLIPFGRNMKNLKKITKK